MKKIITSIVCGIAGVSAGFIIGIGLKIKYISAILDQKSEQADKYNELFQLLNLWVNVKQKGKTLTSYFENKGYNNIAIYGMNYAGETLVNELKGSSICVKYGIDKDAKHIMADFDIITPDDVYNKVDAIIVTPVYYFSEIADALERKVSCPVISLEDIIYESL